MNDFQFRGDVRTKNIAIIYKKSRLAFTKEKASKREINNLQKEHDQTVSDLIRAHEHNLLSIEKVKSVVEDLGFSYRLISRFDLNPQDVKDTLVITVGGDGTLLDTSHHCIDSPILGVNSDPEQSIGALCIATKDTIKSILIDIMENRLCPSPLTRLAIKIEQEPKELLALNDVLFSNENPAATSRYVITKNGLSESHRSSGIWIATPAGSTGGIYSSGGPMIPLSHNEAIFHVREPYLVSAHDPKLLFGKILPNESLQLKSTMNDAHLYIDGSHQKLLLPFGDTATISLSDKPLWLYNGALLNKAREEAIEQRKAYRRLLKDTIN